MNKERPKLQGAETPCVSEWLSHIHALAVGIGPRGPTRPGERQGAEYARVSLTKAGLQPKWEEFRSARSIFHPHLLASVFILVAFAAFPVWGRVTAGISALLTILAVVSQLQELGLRKNLLRLLVPKAGSQNVYAVIPPKGSHERDLVLVGHVDTQRTPLIFRTPGWVKVYVWFSTLAMASFIWQAIVYVLAVPFAWSWIWAATIPSAIAAALLAALCIEAESTPFTAGANDNATGAGLALTLAGRIASDPLPHTRVYVVVTGCEEVQHYGMIDFYRRHRREMKEPRALVFETLGCADPVWSIREGILVPFYGDPKLRRTAERLAAEHPEWNARGASIKGGNTELSDAVRFKVPALALGGMKKNGEIPFWHQKQDTFDKIGPEFLDRAWEMTWTLIQEICRD
jgi:hypothetical protein